MLKIVIAVLQRQNIKTVSSLNNPLLDILRITAWVVRIKFENCIDIISYMRKVTFVTD